MRKISLNKADLLSVLICAAVMIPGISVYSKLPDRIATNFDIYGEPSHYSSKSFTVFGIPLIMTAIQLILCLITNLFHKTGKRDIINGALRFVSPVILYFAELSIILYSLGQMKNPTSVLVTFMAVLIVIAGNYMPKIRRNMFVGIRTPHTLGNQEVWDKTHRFAGVIFTVCGIVMIPFSLVDNWIAVVAILAVTMIIPVIYSEKVYRSVKDSVEKGSSAE